MHELDYWQWYFLIGVLASFIIWAYSTVVSRFSWFDTLVLFPLAVPFWPGLLLVIAHDAVKRAIRRNTLR